MVILNNNQIEVIVKRMAIQILENHYTNDKCYLIGVNNSGTNFGGLLMEELNVLKPGVFELITLKVNPANPTATEVSLSVPVESLDHKSIILIDDVANTGRTLWYASKPLMNILPKSIEAAVLVDRKHKAYPIHVHYVGRSLATTSRNNIRVALTEEKYAVLE